MRIGIVLLVALLVDVKDGPILATDRYTGPYVLRNEGDRLGDATIVSGM